MVIEVFSGSSGSTVLAAQASRTNRRRAAPRQARGILLCRAEDQQNNGSGKVVVNEDVLQRLRAAEAEAAKLREELAAARSQSQVPPQAEVQVDAPKRRIDGGGLRREGLSPSIDDWLNEVDVNNFVTGAAPQSLEPRLPSRSATLSSAFNGTMQRRLLIGIAATVGLGAFALVPTDYLRLSRPSKPLFLMLIPLVRVQALLKEIEGIVAEARWAELEPALQRIQGSPNYLEQNLRDAAASLDSVGARERAGAVAREVIEDVASINYNTYYEAMGRPGSRGGQQEQQFADFSLKATKAAEERLSFFLKLMPREALEAAQQQATVPVF